MAEFRQFHDNFLFDGELIDRQAFDYSATRQSKKFSRVNCRSWFNRTTRALKMARKSQFSFLMQLSNEL